MVNLAQINVTFVAGTLALGGAERQLFYLARGLRQAGANVQVLCLTQGEFWEQKLRDVGASVIWVGQYGSRLSRVARIVARLRRERPGILQSHHFFTNLYVVSAARLLGLREVGAVRNDAYCDVEFTGPLGMLSLRAPRLLAANSRAGVRNAIALGVPQHRIHFLPNVVDTDQFRPCCSRPAGAIRLLTIGMRSEKRVDRFLSVVSHLRQRVRLPIRAVVIGDGPEKARCVKRAAELGLLPDVVVFRGSVAVTASDYQAADIFVLTSDFEGTPNVVLEAMASGLPVVAYRTGGVPEVVRHEETGYVSEMDDESGMVNCLLRLAEHPDLRTQMGTRAREYVEAHHGLHQLPGILSEFYGRALA